MTHIIYIPGLGDKYDVLRKAGLKFWKRDGVRTSHMAMRWQNPDETLDQKMVRLEKIINLYPEDDITLVGESAGGPVAIIAMKRFEGKIKRVITICGMNQGADNVNPYLYKKNRAFKAAMVEVDTIIPMLTEKEKATMRIFYSSGDYTVRPKHTLIKGVKSYDVNIPGHMVAILVILFVRHRQVTDQARVG